MSMKKQFIFFYGVLMGALLFVIGAFVMHQNSTNKAIAQHGGGGGMQGAGASMGSDFAAISGQVQGSESVLWVVTKDSKGNLKLLTYTARGFSTRLLGVRNLKYDKKVFDVTYPPHGKNPSAKPGIPPVESVKEQVQDQEDN